MQILYRKLFNKSFNQSINCGDTICFSEVWYKDVFYSACFFNLRLSSTGIFSKQCLQYGLSSMSAYRAPPLVRNAIIRMRQTCLHTLRLGLHHRQYNESAPDTMSCSERSQLYMWGKRFNGLYWDWGPAHLPSPRQGRLHEKHTSPKSW